MKIWTGLSSILSQCMHLTHTQKTDGRTPFSLLVRAGMPCSTEKNTTNKWHVVHQSE